MAPNEPKKREAAGRSVSQLEAERRYEQRHREKRMQQQWRKHQNALEKRRERHRVHNRTRGHHERPKGKKARPDVDVPSDDVAQIIYHEGTERDLLYFTHERPLTWDDLLTGVTKFSAESAADILDETPVTPKTGRRLWRFWANDNVPSFRVTTKKGLDQDALRLLAGEFKDYIEKFQSSPDGPNSDLRTTKADGVRTSTVGKLTDSMFLADLSEEGGRKLVLHQRIERKRNNVNAKKRAVLDAEGSLACEVCGFNFFQAYGLIGKDFCEVHHRKPLASLVEKQRIKLEDLAIVCSNCHRMLHRGDPCYKIEDLRRLMIKGEGTSSVGL